MSDRVANIRKTGEDCFDQTIESPHAPIDESDLDSPKLLATLGREILIDTTADDVLFALDNAPVGHRMEVKLRSRKF
jgi:hypothetical protein